MGDNLLEKIEGDTDAVIELLRQLTELESPSNRKELVDRLGSLISSQLRRNGLAPQVVPRQEVGDIIWTEWAEGGEGRILVLCHFDTVWEPGSLAVNPFRVEEGRVYGPGVFDMKAGVTACLKVQEYIARGWIRPRKKVRFLFTTDEEVASLHSRELIEEFAVKSDLALVPEPPLPGGALKTFRSGVGTYTLRIQGRSAHTGLDPDKGISAVEELARQILAIHALSAPEIGSRVAVNVVRGGTVRNVIPESAEGDIDTRFRTIEEGERIDSALRQLTPFRSDVALELEGLIDRPPLVKSKASSELFQRAQQLSSELGLVLAEGESGGGSDGNFVAALGVPTLDGLGINGDGAHARHEHIEVAAIAPRVALLALLIERL